VPKVLDGDLGVHWDILAWDQIDVFFNRNQAYLFLFRRSIMESISKSDLDKRDNSLTINVSSWMKHFHQFFDAAHY
jgi:hypothetical protein